MMVDSLEITDADREPSSIAAKNDYDKIVITHGTDTMVKTAEALAKKHEIPKPIVLMGAMIPYAFGNSSMDFSI